LQKYEKEFIYPDWQGVQVKSPCYPADVSSTVADEFLVTAISLDGV